MRAGKTLDHACSLSVLTNPLRLGTMVVHTIQGKSSMLLELATVVTAGYLSLAVVKTAIAHKDLMFLGLMSEEIVYGKEYNERKVEAVSGSKFKYTYILGFFMMLPTVIPMLRYEGLRFFRKYTDDEMLSMVQARVSMLKEQATGK